MAKAEESLNAAELCYAQGFYNSSANRAYYAMFQAAQVALETAGFMRPEWSHAGLHATFANELTRRRKQFAPVLARDLCSGVAPYCRLPQSSSQRQTGYTCSE